MRGAPDAIQGIEIKDRLGEIKERRSQVTNCIIPNKANRRVPDIIEKRRVASSFREWNTNSVSLVMRRAEERIRSADERPHRVHNGSKQADSFIIKGREEYLALGHQR